MGCDFKPYATPGSEMTYNGVYLATKNLSDDEEMKKLFLKSCDGINCKVINNRVFMNDQKGFFLFIKVSKNEEIWLIKDLNEKVFLTILQNKKGVFDRKTLQVLNNLKKIGFEFNLVHLEEWICNGENLSFENCTRKDTEYDNLNYIEFVKSNLSKK